MAAGRRGGGGPSGCRFVGEAVFHTVGLAFAHDGVCAVQQPVEDGGGDAGD